MSSIKALAKVYGKLAAVLDLPPIIYSRFFPRVYLSSRRDVSFPLRSIAETEAQTNALCSHGSTHAVCTQASVQGILVCREGATDNHPDQRHTRVFNSSASTWEGRSREQRAGRKDDGSYITNTPGFTLIVEHFNATRLIRQMASSRRDMTRVYARVRTHKHAHAKVKSELSPFELCLISEITWSVQKY